MIQPEKWMTPSESVVAEVWSAVLGIPISKINRESNFFELGGDSLSSTAVATTLRTIHEKRPTVIRASDVIRCRTVGTLATVMDTMDGRIRSPRVNRRVSGVSPPRVVSGEQEQMLILSTSSGSHVTDAYSVRVGFSVMGDRLDLTKLRKAVSLVSRTHESLRTRYVLKDTNFEQIVMLPDSKGTLSLEVLPTHDDPETCVAKACSETELDLLGPTVPARIFCATSDDGSRSAIGFVASHVCYDGISLDIICRDLSSIYAGQSPELPEVQCSDYALWQRCWMASDSEARSQLDHWTHKLRGTGSGLKPRYGSGLISGSEPQTTMGPSRVRYEIDLESVSILTNVCRRHNATRFAMLLTAYSVALNSAFVSDTHGEGLPIGITVGGRNSESLRHTVGYFVKTLPVVLKTGTFIESVTQAMTGILECHENSDVSIIDIIKALRAEGSHWGKVPFSAFFSMDEQLGQSFELVPGLRCVPFDVITQSGSTPQWEMARDSLFTTSLTVLTSSSGTLVCEFQQDINVVPRQTVEMMVTTFSSIIKAICLSRTFDIPLQLPTETPDQINLKPVELSVPLNPKIVSQLTHIWEEILTPTTPIHPETNFFAIGGNSISAVAVASEVSHRLQGVGLISASELIMYPTLAGMARKIDGKITDRMSHNLPLLLCIAGAFPTRFGTLKRSLTEIVDVEVIDLCGLRDPDSETVETVSQRIISEYVQPRLMKHLPIYVVGYCRGAIIAKTICAMTQIQTVFLLDPNDEVPNTSNPERVVATDFITFFRCYAETCEDPVLITQNFATKIGLELSDLGNLELAISRVTEMGITKCISMMAQVLGISDQTVLRKSFDVSHSISKILSRWGRGYTSSSCGHIIPSTTNLVVFGLKNDPHRTPTRGTQSEILVDCTHLELPDSPDMTKIIRKMILRLGETSTPSSMGKS